MKVLMLGVHRSTKGGMWTVVENYLNNKDFIDKYNVKYIATAVSGNSIKRLMYSVWGLIKVSLYTIFNSYDIIHVHMSERMSVFRKGLFIKISKLRKAKVVIHMHGAEFEDWYNSLSDKKRKKVKKILNNANKVLILGEYWRGFISSLMEDKNKVEVLYNAVDCPERNLYNFNSDKVLFLGAIGKRKGIFDLIECAKVLKEKKRNIKFVLYGPDVTDGIEDIIKENNLEEKIEYRGWLDLKNKNKVFEEEIALNVLPSYNEGLPMTILETMSYGIPNISTNVAAIPEVVNQENGYLIEPGDYIKLAEDILDFFDNNKRKVLSENSYEIIKNNFSIEKHIEKLSEIYKGIKSEKN